MCAIAFIPRKTSTCFLVYPVIVLNTLGGVTNALDLPNVGHVQVILLSVCRLLLLAYCAAQLFPFDPPPQSRSNHDPLASLGVAVWRSWACKVSN
ncbi:uncharacterized protein EI90DRAFT_3056853 [Cantharellus anzutake]|uniref:uncharacterized protein n=1 Tax=Cantharellus anzutake TaxID=1750568 RepID=UPI001904649F|nr:uncharacterized protein EI90DRAFT_3056853 [Cantharellus anzutake]KAF8331658.1 hypothetical protein EI90DRAFT_3056853 [Cantharellus anzutake]